LILISLCRTSKIMKSSRPRHRITAITKLPHLLTRLVLVSAISTMGSVNLLTAIIAAPLTPDIQIKNTAVGSFVDEDSPSGVAPTVVESNEVVVTVAEVAGIDLSVDRLPAEALASVLLAGAYQGNGIISGGDVVYFYYKLTNTGNDPTQFFIPGTPTISATDGSFNSSNPISIIAYDVDGNGATAPVAVNITVPTSGQQTGSNTVGGTDGLLGVNGIIPANGTVTIRVPIKIATTAVSTIAVKLGDTGAGAAQNQTYASGTGDVYTIDNPNGTPGDASGAPINGDRESSLIQTIPVSALAFIPVDFGDAPDSYGTLLTSPNSDFEGGARHQISSLYLGAGVSAEPDATLTGDSNDDGVIFSSNFTAPYQTIVQAGVNNNIRITSNGSGYLNAWIDYNENGKFDNPSEKVFTNQPIVNGENNLSFTPPNTVLHGTTYARFRLSPDSIATPSPTGLIVGGEVEDYRIDVTAPIPNDVSCTTTGLLNGGFESPGINSAVGPREIFTSNIKAYYEIDVSGWNTNDLTEPVVEIWQNGALGVPAYEGSQFVELNAYGNFGLFQDIATIPGQTLRWQFAHRARENGAGVVVDTMQLNVGSPSGSLSSQGIYSTDSTGWILYQGTYVVPSGQFITRFQFDALSTGSGNIGIGNFLDAVKFSTNTCVPTVTPPTIDLDGDNSTAPGNNYLNRFVAGGGAVSAADSDVAIADDGVNISRAVITLTTRPDSNSETLLIDPTAGGTVTGVSATIYNPANGRLSLAGNATKADYQKIIATLKYNNSQAIPTNGDRLIQVQVLDSDSAISNTAISKIVIGPRPNLLLVKRITAINSQRLNTYNQEDANPYDDNLLEPSIAPNLPTYPTADTTKWPGTTGKTTSTFLVGEISGNVKPKDAIEYTIYFLSAGDSAANNVLFCDRVPTNVTFLPTAFNGITAGGSGLSTADRGIAAKLGTDPLKSYTNIADGDFAQYFPPNVEPSTVYPNLSCGGTNVNGAVVVNLGNVNNATAPGTPPESYGFVRFQGVVK
jgi:uncharacterized repeat protein (TIGR01451 family)